MQIIPLIIKLKTVIFINIEWYMVYACSLLFFWYFTETTQNSITEENIHFLQNAK